MADYKVMVYERERNREIYFKYLDGIPMKQLAVEYGVSLTRISQII